MSVCHLLLDFNTRYYVSTLIETINAQELYIKKINVPWQFVFVVINYELSSCLYLLLSHYGILCLQS